MEDVLLEPVELSEDELEFVAGGSGSYCPPPPCAPNPCGPILKIGIDVDLKVGLCL